jgi:hypothetical protein
MAKATKSTETSAAQATLLNMLTDSPAGHIHSIATALNMYFVRQLPTDSIDLSPEEVGAIGCLLNLTVALANLIEAEA